MIIRTDDDPLHTANILPVLIYNHKINFVEEVIVLLFRTSLQLPVVKEYLQIATVPR